ncbi:aminoglycoside N(3)-acetyltransferase [Levilactobacillus tongjiangensis]|uniref:Aminoglycoside N(3)-acetyltransferase n=1 Tax=Levilactobacillus tongjiangensis TaxID=2486023 RepID=A0ABW1SQR6_9LACO|nr:AAC(3) family N-acetyltransferase [Levilactobacillus tongjiangensis]
MKQPWYQQPITTVTTYTDLMTLFQELGLQEQDTCLVHTSLSAFGFIPGGEQTLIAALKAGLAKGNIAMPAQSSDLSDPHEWINPPVQTAHQDQVMAALPGFDRQLTPCHLIGALPEYFRSLPGTQRSGHPTCSMTAWGVQAQHICETTTYDLPFGAQGPLQKLYDLNAKVLFLGTDFETGTAIHLAESTLPRPVFEERAPIQTAGQKQWVSFKMVELEPYDDFNEMGAQFMAAKPESVRQAAIGNDRTALAFSMRDLVDFAREYYRQRDLAEGLN